MKKVIILFLIPCTVLLISCNAPAPPAFDKTAARTAIEAANAHFVATMSAQDHVAHADCYTKDATFMTPGKPTLVGRTAIEADAAKAFKSGVTELGLTTTEVHGMGDMILEDGTYTIGNKEGVTFDKGKYLVLWKKEDGKWKLHRDIYNSDNPPPPPPLVTDKSIHLFDLPTGVTEAAWSKALRDMNAVIEGLGYPGAGYFLYKTEDAETKEYRYYFEGIWPSDEAYTKIHEAPAFIEASKTVGALYDKIKTVEIYRRVHRVD